MKVFPNKRSLLFVCFFFFSFFLQQPERREDWPFSYFGMYKGGRYLTKPLFKFEVIYKDTEREFSPYDFPVDYYFVDERFREILLGTKEDINNDLLTLGKKILKGKEAEADEFLRKNIIPLIRQYCKACKKGKVLLKIYYWDYMTYENFGSPDDFYTYTQVDFER